ncbi:ferredoxin thioredoxin reductase, variable chain [Haematococcus lacustris]
MLASTSQRYVAAPSRPQRPLRAMVAPCASSNGTPFADGSRVKVTKPITVYHIPKHSAGVNIEGMEGEVVKNAANYKGKVLSPNLPVVVKFVTKIGDVDAKFNVHLAEEELAAV